MTTLAHRIREIRRRQGLSAAELARAAQISRQALFAIEQGHMPRADTAVRLARALGVTVETLFAPDEPLRWAGPPAGRARWAVVPAGTVLFPAEDLVADVHWHEGRATPLPQARPPERVVVVAGCDPALNIIARWFSTLHPGWWCDVVPLASRPALGWFAEGLVHVAGIHLWHPDGYNRRWAEAGGRMSVRGAVWEAGLAARTAADLARWREAWTAGRFAVREEGSEARALAERTARAAGLGPIQWPGPPARSHMEAARWVRDGHADAAVTTAPAAAFYGLAFEPWAAEPFDWILPANPGPGVERLLGVLQHPAVRATLNGLPGYDASRAGEPLWES
jgi:putative molybdopterin biosynthesis protein